MSTLEFLLAALSAALALALAYQLLQFRRLRRWAQQARLPDPPEAGGAWGEVFNLLHRHRRANLRRRRQLARLIVRSRRAAQALPYGVTLLDAQARLEWCNAAAQRQLGLDPERDRGQPVANILRHPEFIAWIEAGDAAQALRLRSLQSALALQRVAFDETALLLLSRDVTGEERLEAMRRDFVADVSHELRTPLTVLSGFLETLRDLDLDAGRMRGFVGQMMPYAERMRRIIEDLLTLAALEHAPPPQDARIEMGPLLVRLHAEAEQLSGGRHRILLQAGDGGELAGAETELTGAFQNLIANAVRYTPAGGEIRIAWCGNGRGAEFSVEDTGIGIEPEHLPRLTERFYRVDRGRSRESGGTGLGLAIVKHALMRHQATLEIRSTPGEGSRFAACFPAARLRAAASA